MSEMTWMFFGAFLSFRGIYTEQAVIRDQGIKESIESIQNGGRAHETIILHTRICQDRGCHPIL